MFRCSCNVLICRVLKLITWSWTRTQGRSIVSREVFNYITIAKLKGNKPLWPSNVSATQDRDITVSQSKLQASTSNWGEARKSASVWFLILPTWMTKCRDFILSQSRSVLIQIKSNQINCDFQHSSETHCILALNIKIITQVGYSNWSMLLAVLHARLILKYLDLYIEVREPSLSWLFKNWWRPKLFGRCLWSVINVVFNVNKSHCQAQNFILCCT